MQPCPFSARGAEDFYLQTGPANVFHLFQAVFAKAQGTLSVPIADADDKREREALDELALDESKHYQEKTSKYIRNSLRCIGDPCFWFVMTAIHYARAPLLRFYRFLCVTPHRERMMIVELVSTRISITQSDFVNLMATFPTWSTEALDRSADLPHDQNGVFTPCEKDGLLDAAVSILLHNAAAFDRRVRRFFTRRLSPTQGLGLTMVDMQSCCENCWTECRGTG